MDCPHCSTENLVGAKRCVSCGMPMHVAPTFGASAAAPAVAAPQPAPPSVRGARDELNAFPRSTPPRSAASQGTSPAARDEPQELLCRICQQPFPAPSGRPGRDSTTVCPSCRSLSAQVGGPGGGTMLPTASEAEAVRTARADTRSRVIVHRDHGSRRGVIAVVVGIILVLAGAGVVLLNRESDRGAELVSSARSGAAAVALECPDGFVAHLVTTVELQVTREEARPGGLRAKVIDLSQKSEHESQTAWVRKDDRGAVFDVASHNRLVDQRGKIDFQDARHTNVYPWMDVRSGVRVRTGLSLPPEQLDGESVVPGRDVAPLLHLGALAASTTDLAAGARWKADLALPAAADRRGALVPALVPVEVVYSGTALRSGVKCAVFRISGRSAPTVPADLARELERATGSASGAVWIELATGVVAGADVEVESRRWHEADGIADDLRTRARVVVERR